MIQKLLAVFLLLLIGACDNPSTSVSTQKKGPKNGLVHTYNEDGSISASINYKNNLRHGLALDFYKDGKLRAEINYKDNLKDGLAKWYHKNGNVYRTTSYKDDQRNGEQKKYYEEGELMSEALFYQDHPGIGLKEYNKSGQERKAKPTFSTGKKDLLEDGTMLVKIQLSNKVKEVSLYQGELTNEIYLHENLKEINKTANTGIAKIPPGTNEITVLAKYKTRFKNYRVAKGTVKR